MSKKVKKVAKDLHPSLVYVVPSGLADRYPDSNLVALYDPRTMSPDLRKAHTQLDKAVDKCYRKKAFSGERERMGWLFLGCCRRDVPWNVLGKSSDGLASIAGVCRPFGTCQKGITQLVETFHGTSWGKGSEGFASIAGVCRPFGASFMG